MAIFKQYFNDTTARWALSALKPAPVVNCASCSRTLKCCDFQPFVANFLIGGWLESRSSDRLPDTGHGIWQPIGLIPAKEYRERHQQAEHRTKDLLCEFYDRQKGSCKLWSFRPSECSTFFCGEAEFDRDRLSLSEDTFALEAAVAQMALVEFNLTPLMIAAQVDALNSGLAENTDGMDLFLMYKQAWKWSQTLLPHEVQSWIKNK